MIHQNNEQNKLKQSSKAILQYDIK